MKRDLSYVDTRDFLEALGVRNISLSGSELNFSCPSGNHLNGDNTPSARMNLRTTLFTCLNPACGWRGDAVTFLSLLRNLTESEAQRVIDERYGGPEISAEPGALEIEVARRRREIDLDPDRIVPGEEWVERFSVQWGRQGGGVAEYLIDERGFDAKTLRRWQIGYDEISDRITIPVRDSNGVLVGFKGRAWRKGHEPRYLVIGDVAGRQRRYGFDTYRKGDYVFGADAPPLSGSVVICEGEFNVLALSRADIGAVAIAGSEFSERQREIIVSCCQHVITYLDDDAAGQSGTEKVVSMLEPHLPVSVIPHPPADAAKIMLDHGVATVRELVDTAVPYLQMAVAQSNIRSSADNLTERDNEGERNA